MKPIEFYALHELVGDLQKIFIKMMSGKSFSISDLSRSINARESSTSANLRKLRSHGHTIDKTFKRDGLKNLYTFKLKVNTKVVENYYKEELKKFK